MVAFAEKPSPLFKLGKVVATPGALAFLENAVVDLRRLLARHERGDWGDVSEGDKIANNEALKDGSRIFSAYKIKNEEKVWIITEATGDDGKRASTCALLPDEY